MGWSIDTARLEMNKIFKEANTSYRLTHPQAIQQTVTVEYLGDKELPNRFKLRIVELFPDFVYVEFVRVQASQVVGDQMRWDN